MNFQEALDALFERPRRRTVAHRSMTRLDHDRLVDGSAALHVDFHEDDPDHVYLITVERVPRVRLPLPAPVVAAEIGGVRALLVRVSIANHVEVTLDAEDTPRTRATTEGYRAAVTAWAESTGPDRQPPTSPGATTFPHVPITVTDDAGTEYRRTGGSGGGPETPWRMHWDFRPVPPPEARRLTIRFPAGETIFTLPGRR
ncbi:hypothetical protein [Actinoplanes sp. NPDC020271]|uniref:hypothetical protein n=1 Tax=Actinoplanes sp. NPDC020271 TaxID=3363896 RepID=UPI0037AA9B02